MYKPPWTLSSWRLRIARGMKGRSGAGMYFTSNDGILAPAAPKSTHYRDVIEIGFSFIQGVGVIKALLFVRAQAWTCYVDARGRRCIIAHY